MRSLLFCRRSSGCTSWLIPSLERPGQCTEDRVALVHGEDDRGYLMTCHGFATVEETRAALYQVRQIEEEKKWTTMLLLELSDPKIEQIIENERDGD
jgi:hypothetical protein